MIPQRERVAQILPVPLGRRRWAFGAATLGVFYEPVWSM
jgi:hypothetical protein